MSDPNPTPPPEETQDDSVDSSTTIDLETVVSAFLSLHPTPTDDQLHKFAELLGIDYAEFENQVFKMFGEALEDEDIEDVVDDEELIGDELDLFLVAFFTYLPEPEEDQVHKLAEMLSISPEEVEERVFRMLSILNEEDEDEEGAGSDVLDEDEDLLADDEDENVDGDDSESDDEDEDLSDEEAEEEDGDEPDDSEDESGDDTETN